MADKTGATSGANNSEGTNSSNTDAATATAQTQSGQSATEGTENNSGQTYTSASEGERISFTPAQQTWINSKIADEKRKAVEAANKKAAEEKDLSDKEKAEKDRDEARAQLAERDKRDAFKTAVSAAKVVDPDALYKLVGDDLEFENDKFKNLSKVLDQAKVNHSYLFPKVEASADGGKEDKSDEIEVKPGVDRMRNAYASSEKAKE